MIRRAGLLPLLLAGGVAGAQTPVVRLDDPGQGQGPAILARALARPHVVIAPGAARFVIPRDTAYTTTVIVLGRETAVEGRVDGDLIVVAADLYVRPRAVVNGQAVAIGGGLYESTMARVRATASFRDFTYDIAPAGSGFTLRYRSLYDRPATAVSWPGLFGLRLPAYDRSNGVSVRAGPLITPPGTSWRIEPRVTYRSQLGRVDPRLAASAAMNSRSTFRVSVERGTFTNEEWIWAEILNSAATLTAGNDARNYYRASRAQASMSRRWDWESSDAAPYIGVRAERDYSVRPDTDVTSGPWSFTNRKDRDDMWRPNPQIDEGYLYAGLAGVAATWSKTSLTARLMVDGEFGAFYPLSGTAAPSTGLAQTTIDGSVTFPTFGLQSIRVDGHFVVTLTEDTPRQRWAYVGGPGSISTLETLERGGDQLVFVDFRYNIPITRIVLPVVGSPIFTIREVLAGADVGRFPSIAQAVGARVTLGPLYLQFLYDPSDRNGRFGGGITLIR